VQSAPDAFGFPAFCFPVRTLAVDYDGGMQPMGITLLPNNNLYPHVNREPYSRIG